MTKLSYSITNRTFKKVTLVIFARLSGDLQAVEWKTFDWFLRLRPPEAQDDRVVIALQNQVRTS